MTLLVFYKRREVSSGVGGVPAHQRVVLDFPKRRLVFVSKPTKVRCESLTFRSLSVVTISLRREVAIRKVTECFPLRVKLAAIGRLSFVSRTCNVFAKAEACRVIARLLRCETLATDHIAAVGKMVCVSARSFETQSSIEQFTITEEEFLFLLAA